MHLALARSRCRTTHGGQANRRIHDLRGPFGPSGWKRDADPERPRWNCQAEAIKHAVDRQRRPSKNSRQSQLQRTLEAPARTYLRGRPRLPWAGAHTKENSAMRTYFSSDRRSGHRVSLVSETRRQHDCSRLSRHRRDRNGPCLSLPSSCVRFKNPRGHADSVRFSIISLRGCSEARSVLDALGITACTSAAAGAGKHTWLRHLRSQPAESGSGIPGT